MIRAAIGVLLAALLLPHTGWAAFTDNGDGTISDSTTGLVWQKDGDTAGQKTWENALSYCQALDLGGEEDWRLPDRKELQSIVDYTADDPAIAEPPFYEHAV
ncbi:MAG: DUF1566 domain-containing protein [Desulfovibrionaceae bacterium]